MSVALIQPQFAPNLYDLASMLKSDRVILLDTDIWSRKGRTHRAKIRNEEGTQWLNIPIRTEDKKKPISDVRIDHSEPWFEAFWNAILHNYSTATWFDFYQDELYAEFEKASGFEKLIDFDLLIFNRLLTYLEVSIDYQLLSKELISIDNKTVNYQEYQSKNYIKQLDNSSTPLSLHPKYKQAHAGFKTECSCLDLLLNYGRESYKVLELITE